MRKTFYRCAYDTTAIITEHNNGTATLVMDTRGTRSRRTYKNAGIAKRVLSRAVDGFYWEVES